MTDYKIGYCIKILYDCAEVKKEDMDDDSPFTTTLLDFKHILREPEYVEAAKQHNTLLKIGLAMLRVGCKVFVNDDKHGKIYGTVVEETCENFVVKFDIPPKAGSPIFIEE